MNKKQILEAFYQSGRPVDVIDPDGWHMLMFNTGSGIVCVGMWRDGEPVHEVEWKDHLCGQRHVPISSTARFALDAVKECANGWRLESINSGRYNR